MTAETATALPALPTLTQWQSIESKARQAVLESIKQPQIDDFVSVAVSKYPRWLNVGVVAMLCAVILGAFVVSAGKQLVSYDSILGHLATHTRLSPLWVTVSLVAGVLLSEIGALLFSLAGAVFGAGSHQRVFRATAALCAFMAVLANVAVTSSYSYDGPVMTVLAWFLTFFVPGVVLVGALVGERLILENLNRRAGATVEYGAALGQYRQWVADPSLHPGYLPSLKRHWLEMIRRKADSSILDNPEMVSSLAARDFAYYMTGGAANFQQPAIKPELTAGQPG